MDPKRNNHRPKTIKGPTPKVVGQPRNEFGTRLCQRIVCEKCSKVDYVPVRISLDKSGLCRDCAERVLAAYDQGRHIQEKKKVCVCEQCHCEFLANESVTKKKLNLLCMDCYRGFSVWRGKASIKKRIASGVRLTLTKTGSRTTFRKVIDDTI